jgi:enoyl-CoA hydratase/carnithine racemase
MPTYQDLLYATNDGVATITINRPSRLNAFNAHTLDELKEALEHAGANHSVGVVVLTGAGDRAFSSGGDINWEASGGLKGHTWHLGRQIVEHPKPVIARVSGYPRAPGSRKRHAIRCTPASA